MNPEVEDMMNQEELMAQFDEWAHSYDQELETSIEGFPFAGYFRVLSTLHERARVAPGMTVMDLGIGTGNLAKLFVESGCQVLGVDFSSEMLAKARAKLPEVELVQADLTLGEWPAALDHRFDRIVSNYVFHEFQFETKMRVLSRLARNNLGDGGRILIGDIAFPTIADLQRTREELADKWEEEFYWVTDETREELATLGWRVEYMQISFCAGVYLLEPPAGRLHRG